MKASEIESALHWRYATKKFDPSRKILENDWKALEDSLLYSPSSYGLQPWKFLVVENASLRERMRLVSWNQSQVVDASHYVVFLYKEKMDRAHIAKYVDRISEVRGIDRTQLTKYEEMMVGDLLSGTKSETLNHWASAQTYIAMGFLLQTAAVLKIDACPMEGLDAKAYDELLGVSGTGFKTLAAVALGYRDASDRYQQMKKVRFLPADVIGHVK